jgi:hypothetical protein
MLDPLSEPAPLEFRKEAKLSQFSERGHVPEM